MDKNFSLDDIDLSAAQTEVVAKANPRGPRNRTVNYNLRYRATDSKFLIHQEIADRIDLDDNALMYIKLKLADREILCLVTVPDVGKKELPKGAFLFRRQAKEGGTREGEVIGKGTNFTNAELHGDLVEAFGEDVNDFKLKKLGDREVRVSKDKNTTGTFYAIAPFTEEDKEKLDAEGNPVTDESQDAPQDATEAGAAAAADATAPEVEPTDESPAETAPEAPAAPSEDEAPATTASVLDDTDDDENFSF